MNHIDRLLIQAREVFNPPVYGALCIIDHDYITGKWNAVPLLWDGVPGSGFMPAPADWKTEYDTPCEASEAANTLFSSLNISDPECLVIIVDDVGELEE